MKKFRQILLILCLVILTGCAIFKNEAERSVKSDVREYISEVQGEAQIKAYVKEFVDEKFDTYARDYSERRITSYKVKLNWILGLATAFLGIIGTSGGLVVLNRKLKQKKNENV